MVKNDWKNALILGGTTTALAFARSLGQKGVAVKVMASSFSQPGMHSKWGNPLVIPDAVRQPEECLDRLIKWGRSKTGKTVLIPTLEEYVKILSDCRHDLEEFFLFRIPPAPLVDTLLDKKTQYQLMERIGLNIPLTVYSDEDNFINSVSGKIGFPCLFKPCRSYIWRQVPGRFKARVVNSPRELQVLCRNLASLGLTFLAQEIIPGGNECLHSYLACYSSGSQPIAESTARKIRQHPDAYGTGSLIISTDNPEISSMSREILERISYAGHVDMEYKLDPRDRSWKLIEINIRCTSFVQLAIASGIDLPWIGYLETGYKKPDSPSIQKPGVLFMHLGWDLQAVLSSGEKRWRAFFSWLLLIRKVSAFAVFNFIDFKPIIWELSDYIRRLPGWIREKNRKSS